MSFLYPGFLWALSALAIPVIIHLFYFRRYQRVFFTNVRFLREIKEETATRNRLKHRLILLARLLALTALVFAFAQPFLPDENAARQRASQQVSIFVDNSFSMDALGEDRSLFEQARDRARLIAGAYGPDDRFQLLSGDLQGGQQRLLDKDAFLAALDELTLSPKSPSFQQVHDRQRDALSRAEPGSGVAYLLSDFQRSAASFAPDTALKVNLVPLQGTEQRNLTLDSVWFEEPVQVMGQQASLHVRIHNYGIKDAEKIGIRLLFNQIGNQAGNQTGNQVGNQIGNQAGNQIGNQAGNQSTNQPGNQPGNQSGEQVPGQGRLQGENQEIKAIGEVDVPAGQAVLDTLSFTVPDQGWQLGEVQITDYPVTFDDTWFFSFKVAAEVPVLVIGGAEGNTFLNTLFGANPLFRLENRPAENVDYSALGQNRLIVLDGLPRLSSGLVAELQEYMQGGGALLVFPGENADAASYNELLNRAGATLGDRVNRSREVGSLNAENPLFRQVFSSVPRNLALPTASLSYRIPASVMSLEDNLMRFKDGDSFLGRFAVGKGALYLCASPLTRQAGDFPVQGGLFVPFVFRLAVLGSGDQPLAHLIGRDEWIELGADVSPSLMDQDQQPLVRLDDRLEFLPRVERGGDRLRINVAEQATQAGQYTIVLPDGGDAGRFAMNYDRRESRLEFLDPDKLAEAYPAGSVRVLDQDSNKLAADVGRISEGRRLWQACLILALAFLGLEILLIRLL